MLSGRQGWRGNGQTKPVSRSCRFNLEQLEHRLAPAVFHVNTFQDTVAVNVATGQDAAGHVSLRSAVTAANADAQEPSAAADTIVLQAGAYVASSGILNVHGDLQIIGQGPGQTLVETRHLDRLFEVEGGSLQLTDMTLNGGSESTLLNGSVHLSNCAISDTDIAAVVDALMAYKAPAPPEQAPLIHLTSNQQEAPEPIHQHADPVHLLGPVGGGSTEQDQHQEATAEAHQAFWRADVDVTPEQATPAMPDEAKGNHTDKSDVPTQLDHKDESMPVQREIKQPESKSVYTPLMESGRAPLVHRNGRVQSVALLLALSFGSYPSVAKKRPRTLFDWRNHTRRANALHETRKNRGPPSCGRRRPQNHRNAIGQTSGSARFVC